MPYVIDGHNLIGALPDIELDDPDDEGQLVQRLRGLSLRAGPRAAPIEVFFDSGSYQGTASSLSGRGVLVHFSGSSQTADDAIVAFLRQSPQPGRFDVVTDDRELAGRARAAGAKTISTQEFAHRLAPRRLATAPYQAAARGLDPHDPAFADIYRTFLHEAPASVGRRAATPAELAVLEEKIHGEDTSDAEQAALTLGSYRGHGALALLRDALTHMDARVRAAALLALGGQGEPAAWPDITLHLAYDPAAMAREAAAQSLGRAGDRSVEGPLTQAAASDPKSKVRKAASRALEAIRARGGGAPPAPAGRRRRDV